jgi:hypothetical protein
MFRFDGEVFLLGTAIAAPLNASRTTIKIATICASSQRDNPRAAAGSSRTAAPIAARAPSASAPASASISPERPDVCFRPIADISPQSAPHRRPVASTARDDRPGPFGGIADGMIFNLVFDSSPSNGTTYGFREAHAHFRQRGQTLRYQLGISGMNIWARPFVSHLDEVIYSHRKPLTRLAWRAFGQLVKLRNRLRLRDELRREGSVRYMREPITHPLKFLRLNFHRNSVSD